MWTECWTRRRKERKRNAEEWKRGECCDTKEMKMCDEELTFLLRTVYFCLAVF
jgi:hypothetical protein